MTPTEIAKGRELLASARLGPLVVESRTIDAREELVEHQIVEQLEDDPPLAVVGAASFGGKPAAILIVFAVNNLGPLLDEVERLRAENARLATGRTDVVGPFVALASSMCVGGNHPLKAGECWCGKYKVTEATGAVLTDAAVLP